MKTHAIYGLGMAAIGSVLILVLNLCGFHNDPNRFLIGLGLGFLGAIVITIVGLVIGIRAVRNSRGSGKFSYGQALLAGLIITVFSTVGSSAFQVVYSKWINPTYTETAVQWTQSMMEKANIPQDKVDEKLTEMREKSGVAYQIRNGLIGGIFFGGLISLIAAAFLKRQPENTTSPS